MRKIRNLIWYLRYPIYWAHLRQVVLKRFRPNLDTSEHRKKAADWAKQHAKSIPQVLFDLGLAPSADIEIPKMDSAIIEKAQGRAAKSGYKMGGPGDIDLLYATTLVTSSHAAVETGVAYGWSSLAILSAMDRLGGGRLASVDMPS